jgi:hypothetical protein
MDGERDLLNVKYEAIVSEFAPKLVSHVEHCIPYHAIKIKTNPHEKAKARTRHYYTHRGVMQAWCFILVGGH